MIERDEVHVRLERIAVALESVAGSLAKLENMFVLTPYRSVRIGQPPKPLESPMPDAGW